MPAIMTADTLNNPRAARPARRSRLWLAVYAIIFAFVAVLAVETALRIRFPWDLYAWPESPFLTNLMKLDHHQPIYTNPADGNSFIYSPGLEYLCFAILKPFALELDIRYCRLISVALGVFASGFGALAVRRLAGSCISVGRTKIFFFATWGLIWLVLSKNWIADLGHPDNLHAFHATLIFWLSLVAVETRRFGVALLTMLVAGVGVFTKQTEALSFAGPALVFAIYNPWGWRRWLLLAAIGAATVAVSVYVLWLPAYARFWTFDLPRQQGVWPGRAYTMLTNILVMDRGVLSCLAILAALCLWQAGNSARRFLVCWVCVGIFTALPNAAAYLKTMGGWNDLIIFEIWMVVLVWPFFGILADSLSAAKPAPREVTALPWDSRFLPAAVCALMVFFILLLVPMKVPPRPGDYAFCRQVENAVRADLQAGRKVLVSYSAEILIRAGATKVPLDRSASIEELVIGNLDSMSGMKARIDGHYYDRIYLIRADWYHDAMLDDINRNYAVDYIIPPSPYKAREIYGYGDLMDGCPVLSPGPQK